VIQKAMAQTSGTVHATCLRCGHEGTISPATLRRYGQSPNVTLAYLSRFTKCEVCSSKAVKLERKAGDKGRSFHSAR